LSTGDMTCCCSCRTWARSSQWQWLVLSLRRVLPSHRALIATSSWSHYQGGSCHHN